MNKIVTSFFKKQVEFNALSQGKSMYPLFLPGDQVYFKNKNFNKIKVNNFILVYKKELFIHRVIYKTTKYLITKGDNNLHADGKIYPKNVLAKVHSLKRNNKIITPEQYYMYQSTAYFHELRKILLLFDKKKIDYVFLKGLPLYLFYSRKLPEKIYTDCDLLVSVHSYLKLKNCLLEEGYEVERIKHLAQKIGATQYVYQKKIGSIYVRLDIHLKPYFMVQTLLPNVKLKQFYDQALAKKIEVKYLKIRFNFLSKPDLLIFLTLHYFHHNYKGSHRLYFLDLIMNSYAKNMATSNILEETVSKAKEYHLENFITPAFKLLNLYFPKSKYSIHLKKAIQMLKPNKQIAINRLDIFNEEKKFKSHIKNIFLIFRLSPNPWYINWVFIFQPIFLIKSCVFLIWFLQGYLYSLKQKLIRRSL